MAAAGQVEYYKKELSDRDMEMIRLKKENENLKKTTVYLNKKCEEMINDKSDDVLVGLLKKKINDLETLQEESEQEYDNQLNLLRKRASDLQKENNRLQKELMDKKYESGGGSIEAQETQKKKTMELEEDNRLKTRLLKDKEVELETMKDKMSRTQIALDYHMPLSMSTDGPLKKTVNATNVKKYDDAQIEALLEEAVMHGAPSEIMNRLREKISRIMDERERIMNINENLTAMVQKANQEKAEGATKELTELKKTTKAERTA
jgi:hypothetical protein